MEVEITNPNHDDRPPTSTLYRVNRAIRTPTVRVIAPDGTPLGIMTPDEGISLAQERGLDLVEVAPAARPPVCRIMDYGKFFYMRAKRVSAARRPRDTIKTLRLRLNTTEHDLSIKLGHALAFLEKGHRVRLEVRLRGRQRGQAQACVDLLWALVVRLREGFDGDVRVVSAPNVGRARGTVDLVPQPRA